MKQLALALALSALMVTSAFALTDAELKTGIVGTWDGSLANCDANSLMFEAGGLFKTYGHSGSYSIKDGHMTGVMATGETLPEVIVDLPNKDSMTMTYPGTDVKDVFVRCPATATGPKA
jgi:hypothetical protein